MTVRRFGTAPTRIRGQRGCIANALRGVNFDTFGSLSFVFVSNAALLIVAAAAFHASGHRNVTDLADAHRLIARCSGRWPWRNEASAAAPRGDPERPADSAPVRKASRARCMSSPGA
jgi:hypothetical protein